MTFESPQVRLFLQQYLLNALVSTNNVYVKMKVLKIFQVGTNIDNIIIFMMRITVSIDKSRG